MYNLIPQEFLKVIYSEHYKELGKNLAGIVLCGSAASHTLDRDSDIDYVVIVKNLDQNSYRILAELRIALEKRLGLQCSNTAVEYSTIKDLKNSYMYLDGKAVQACIDSNKHNTLLSSNCAIPILSLDTIRKFSVLDFHKLKALTIKQLVRLSHPASYGERRKLIKLAYILCKVYAQASNTIEEKEYMEDIRDSLMSIKNNIRKYSDSQLVEVIARVMSLNLH